MTKPSTPKKATNITLNRLFPVRGGADGAAQVVEAGIFIHVRQQCLDVPENESLNWKH